MPCPLHEFYWWNLVWFARNKEAINGEKTLSSEALEANLEFSCLGGDEDKWIGSASESQAANTYFDF